jgi:hypothetical protein
MPTDGLPPFSPEEAYSLNKTLFLSENLMTPLPASPPKMIIRISIGDDSNLGKNINNMKIGSRVYISPIYPNQDDSDSFYERDEQLSQSFAAMTGEDDVEKMPPPTAPRPRQLSNHALSSASCSTAVRMSESSPLQAVTQDTPFKRCSGVLMGDEDPAQPTPFESCGMIKHLNTPGTASTVENSFWSEQLEMSPVPYAMSADKRAQTDKTGSSPMAKKRREVNANDQ